MARPVVITKALATAAADNIAQSQALAAAGDLTLNGTTVVDGVAVLDTQRRVLLTSGGNDSAIIFTVYGTLDSGVAISETLAGGNGGAVATQQDFKRVTRIAASGAVATTIEAGTNGVGSSPWFVLNAQIDPFYVGAQFNVLSGTGSWALELTDDEVLRPIPIYQPGFDQTQPIPSPYAWTGMSAMAAATQGVVNHPCRAARLTVNSGTGTGQLVLTQAGIRN